MPAGVLYVKLIEAEHVPNMDIFSKTDPFVKLYVRKRNQRRSKTIYNKLHPKCAVAMLCIHLCVTHPTVVSIVLQSTCPKRIALEETLEVGRSFQMCVINTNFIKLFLPAHVQWFFWLCYIKNLRKESENN